MHKEMKLWFLCQWRVNPSWWNFARQESLKLIISSSSCIFLIPHWAPQTRDFYCHQRAHVLCESPVKGLTSLFGPHPHRSAYCKLFDAFWPRSLFWTHQWTLRHPHGRISICCRLMSSSRCVSSFSFSFSLRTQMRWPSFGSMRGRGLTP